MLSRLLGADVAPVPAHTMKPRAPSDTFLLLASACVGAALLFSYFGRKSVPSLLLDDLTHFVVMVVAGVVLAMPATHRKACTCLVSGPLAIVLWFLVLGDALGGHRDELPLLLRPAVLFAVAPALVLAICRVGEAHVFAGRWQRMALVVSIAWVLGAGLWALTRQVDAATARAVSLGRVCLEAKQQPMQHCLDEQSRMLDASLAPEWGEVAFIVFVPLLGAGCLGLAGAFVFRRVRAGAR